jgi:hypothetical protein
MNNHIFTPKVREAIKSQTEQDLNEKIFNRLSEEGYTVKYVRIPPDNQFNQVFTSVDDNKKYIQIGFASTHSQDPDQRFAICVAVDEILEKAEQETNPSDSFLKRKFDSVIRFCANQKYKYDIDSVIKKWNKEWGK